MVQQRVFMYIQHQRRESARPALMYVRISLFAAVTRQPSPYDFLQIRSRIRVYTGNLMPAGKAGRLGTHLRRSVWLRSPWMETQGDRRGAELTPWVPWEVAVRHLSSVSQPYGCQYLVEGALGRVVRAGIARILKDSVKAVARTSWSLRFLRHSSELSPVPHCST